MTGAPLLRHRGFGSLVVARLVSFLGDGVTRTALVLLTARHGPAAVSVVLLAVTVPKLLGPLGGALADRWDRRRLMRSCGLAQAAALAVIAATLPPLPVLALLVATSSLLATAFGPASTSSVPELVPPADLRRANALVGAAFNVQLALGPAVGGLLVGLGSTRIAFAADAGTFALLALLLGRLPKLPPPQRPTKTGSVWTSTRDGVDHVRRSRRLRLLAIGTVIFVAFAAVDNVALVFLVERRLHGSATAYGLVQAAFGVGMLTASLGLVRLRRQLGSGRLLLTGGAATVTGSLLTACAPGLAFAAGAQAVAGSGNGLEEVATTTFVQQIVPPQLLGRVFGALATAAQLGIGVAYLAAAPLVAAAGPRVAFVVAGVGAMAGLSVLVRALHTPPAKSEH
jgi:MFS family permease